MRVDPDNPWVPRALLAKYFGKDPRLLAAFENQAIAVQEQQGATAANADATTKLQDASIVTLSPNDALTNEYVLSDGDGTELAVGAGKLNINVDDTVARTQTGKVKFIPPGDITLFLPAEGTLLSDLSTATLNKPVMTGLVNAASDAAAAGAGVPLNGVYHNAGVLRVRLV